MSNYHFTINLNEESAAVLLRCLSYGESSISQSEADNGVESVLKENIDLIRNRICKELADHKIQKTAEALNSKLKKQK